MAFPGGWVTEGVSIGTGATGFVAGGMMDEVTETTYKDLKGYIDQWTFLTCRRSKGDPSDTESGGKNGNGSNGGGIGHPVPIGLIDPSGYLYEGVEDNRIEGVTATAFEKIDGEWTLWDAEWFAQENPLITDIEGRYQWDVPEGWWQVMYEKEGYEIALSDELPVPPPQLEVNIGMISLASPTVEISAEYGGIVNLTFDKYMNPATIENATFKVFNKELDEFGNKIYIAGTITAVDAKENPKDKTTQLARIYKFTPNVSLETGGTYTVWVSNMVSNYAGKTMDAAALRDVTIPEKPYVPPVDNGSGDSEEIKEEAPKVVLQTIEYQIKPEEDSNALVVYKKDAQGNLIIVKASVYDPVTGTMRFMAEEGATYVVGYNPIQFNDIDMWAKDHIAYLASRGIIDGVGGGMFDPQRSITRAEFLKLLVSIGDSINFDQYTQSNFNDVKTEDWYWKYIEWAADNNVVSGYGDGSFGPTDTITREQMAMMLSNFIKAIGLELDSENGKIDFTDAEQIATWARNAINEMQEFGIINGRTGGTYDPKGHTTRAEAAKVVAEILNRFI